LHELGVSFDEEIELRDFVGVAKGTDLFSLEKIEPVKLVGSVLLIEDNDVDARMFTHFLRDTQLRVKRAANGADGIDLAMQEFSLIVCDYRLPDMTAIDLVKRIRELGIVTTVLICTGDPLAMMKQGGFDENRTGIVTKPLVQQTLLRAMAEHLLVAGRGEPNADHRSGGINVSSNVVEYGVKLVAVLDKQDIPALRDICDNLRSAGAAAGDNNLMRLAENASTILGSKGLDFAKPLFKELVRLTNNKAA
jgi:CheY-like chemotaxis protein